MYLDQSQVQSLQKILNQSELGIHVLFDNDLITDVFKQPYDEDEFFTPENIKKVEAAFVLGKLLAKKAIDKKIEKVVFDRKGYRYHGRIKSLADGAREGGLKF